MNTNNLTPILLAIVLTSLGIFALTQVETNLPVVGIAVSYLAALAIFGLAAYDGTKAKRLS